VAASLVKDSDRGASEAIERVRTQVQQCIAEARQAIWELRSPRLETRSLGEALHDLADQGHWGAPARIAVDVNGYPRRRSPVVEEQLLRIAREAITNAIRKGGAAHVQVTVDHRPRSVSLRVMDDGCGFDPERAPHDGHYGIAGMKERAERLGGTLHITSTPGTGSVVEASVPLN
jgi:signal transduction histidine kinase